MYLEKLKEDLEELKIRLEEMANNSENIDNKEIIKLKRECLQLEYKIKIETLFNDYTSKKPMKYHFVDKDGSEEDIMLDYGDVNYDKAYKESRNSILADEIWAIMKFDKDNSYDTIEQEKKPMKKAKHLKPRQEDDSLEKTHDDNDKTNSTSIDAEYLVFKVAGKIHIISKAPITYLKENVEIIKKYTKDDNCRFFVHEYNNLMMIDGVLVKKDNEGYTLKGKIDEYESSEKVNIISETKTEKMPPDDSKTEKTIDSQATTKIAQKKPKQSKDSSAKKANSREFINLMKEDKFSDILKLIKFYGIANMWKAFDEGLTTKLITKDEYNSFVSYLKNKTSDRIVLGIQLFNDDFIRINQKYANKDVKKATPFLPAVVKERKPAKKSLIKKIKELSNKKKIAIITAACIALSGTGFLAYKLTHKKSNPVDYNTSTITATFENQADEVTHINEGDTVYESADESIQDINGLSATGDFRDTVVAVYDPETESVTVLTPENVESLRPLIDDPNIPKAFGDSFEEGHVDGWKTGNGYKTIFDVDSKTVGGRTL